MIKTDFVGFIYLAFAFMVCLLKMRFHSTVKKNRDLAVFLHDLLYLMEGKSQKKIKNKKNRTLRQTNSSE